MGAKPRSSGSHRFAVQCLRLDYIFRGIEEPYYSADILRFLRGLRKPARSAGAQPSQPFQDDMMTTTDSRVTIHMVASLDGFVARRDGRVDWLETSDEFADGEALDAADAKAFLDTIDCYVMGSRTYETAIRFESEGLGWAYGDTPTFVLTSRKLTSSRETVRFHSGDLTALVGDTLRPAYRNIWVVGGALLSTEWLRLGLADEVRYSILPILLGEGIPFVHKIGFDIPLHLAEVKAYTNGIVELRYEVPDARGAE